MIPFQQKLDDFLLFRYAMCCSKEEVASLDQQCNGTLPETYRQFMRRTGKGGNDFLLGSDFTFEQIDGMKESADELLADSGLDPLDPDAFVFAMHQGYQFYYFQDEVVYYYMECEDHIEKKYDSFEEFFDDEVADLDSGRVY